MRVEIAAETDMVRRVGDTEGESRPGSADPSLKLLLINFIVNPPD
jgi:hypothetical protein